MRERQAPYRPRTDSKRAAEVYNDGVVTIYDVRDEAVNGFMPAPVYQVKATLAYQERKLGIRRYYDARQNQVRVERVIRVPKPSGVFQPEGDAPEPMRITNQDAARTEDGKLYRIDMVQSVPDVYPPSLDLTLAVYEQNPVTRWVPDDPIDTPVPEPPELPNQQGGET